MKRLVHIAHPFYSLLVLSDTTTGRSNLAEEYTLLLFNPPHASCCPLSTGWKTGVTILEEKQDPSRASLKLLRQ